MKENKTSEKIKHFAKKKWDNFTDWFKEKEHPRSKLNKNVFFHDSLKLIGFILVFLIIYSNIDKINQIVLIFIKLGSLLQLVLLFFILRKAWHLTINLKYAFRGLNHGTKAIIAIVVVLLLFMAFLNQDSVVNSITQTYEEANFSKINPIQIGAGISLFQGTQKTTIEEIRKFPEKYIDKKIKIDGLTWQCDAVLPEWKDKSCIKEKINSSSYFLPVNEKFTNFNQNISLEGFLRKESRGIYLEVLPKDSSSNSILNSINSKPVNAIKIDTDKYDFFGANRCSMIESAGESQGISNPKQKQCRAWCGEENMEYSSYECVKDKLICYCLE